MIESILYYFVKSLGFLVRRIPAVRALGIGRWIGGLGYHLDFRHKRQVYINLRRAFAASKSPAEIRKITKQVFQNFAQNFVELLRMPLFNLEQFETLARVEGKEHITESLKQGKGVILLAMHFGSWEFASLFFGQLGHPYKMVVKPQTRFVKLDYLLNSYRSCRGSVVITRGIGTREFVRSLKNNEVIGMVIDQGGREGVLVPFLGREASLSSGALRMGLKLGTPICFGVIYREWGVQHRMVIHPPVHLAVSGNLQEDLASNLKKITPLMEEYIHRYPGEYMWFYKIWKYSKERDIVIFSDEKAGHLRQSQTVAQILEQNLAKRGMKTHVHTIPVIFRNPWLKNVFGVLSLFLRPFLTLGRLEFLKIFLSKESYRRVVGMRGDYLISCGSSVAGINNFLSKDLRAKSIVVQRPGLLSCARFDLVILPKHDAGGNLKKLSSVVTTQAVVNLAEDSYVQQQAKTLTERFPLIGSRSRYTIGILLGGESKYVSVSEAQVRALIRQIKNVCRQLNARALITTSRRTPPAIEQILVKEFKRDPLCPLLILANQDNVPEAFGGILGLSDILVVSGDSISMISEAASSGKNTIVFYPQQKSIFWPGAFKHKKFIDRLSADGFIFGCDPAHVGDLIFEAAKHKIKTQRINDRESVAQAVNKII